MEGTTFSVETRGKSIVPFMLSRTRLSHTISFSLYIYMYIVTFVYRLYVCRCFLRSFKTSRRCIAHVCDISNVCRERGTFIKYATGDTWLWILFQTLVVEMRNVSRTIELRGIVKTARIISIVSSEQLRSLDGFLPSLHEKLLEISCQNRATRCISLGYFFFRANQRVFAQDEHGFVLFLYSCIVQDATRLILARNWW